MKAGEKWFRITFIIWCIIITPYTFAQRDSSKIIKCAVPPYLKTGDKVALICPSYYSSMELAENTANIMRKWGFEPVIGKNVGKQYLDKYGGTPEERLEDLCWALNEPDIKAIICLRGGYGTLQLVDSLPLKEMTANSKWIVGYSDITTLLNMEVCAGNMGIHAVMGCNIAPRNGADLSCTLLRDLLKGQVPLYETPAHPLNIPGHGSGILVGGNLCTLAPLMSSQADTYRNNDIILFLEEVEESMHNIDRLFNILRMNGILTHCKGIILGGFSDCEINLGHESIEAMLHEYIKPYNIPLVCGFPAGHEKVNLPLLIGAPATLDVRSDGATLTFNLPGKSRTVRTAGLQKPQKIEAEMDDSQFVNLTDVIPEAILEIRYFSTYNFVGERIDGYLQPTALMTRQAADSLRAVSDELMRLGYRLKIFDAYRPKMAVKHFVRWASKLNDTLMKRYFYPQISKSILFDAGYISSRSSHTRGSTVDLTLFDMRTGKEVDMGGTFDWFGIESHPDFGGNPYTGKYTPNSKITAEQFHNRMILREAMIRHGFKPVSTEWWHFTLKDEPFPNTYFEFPVKELGDN